MVSTTAQAIELSSSEGVSICTIPIITEPDVFTKFILVRSIWNVLWARMLNTRCTILRWPLPRALCEAALSHRNAVSSVYSMQMNERPESCSSSASAWGAAIQGSRTRCIEGIRFPLVRWWFIYAYEAHRSLAAPFASQPICRINRSATCT